MDALPEHAPARVLADRFELRRVLGTGGMATVWAAHDRRLGRTVAVKVLRSDLSAEHAGRIEREARAAARIDDPRVVTVLDLDHDDDGTPFLVLEALDGRTLAEELRDGPLGTERGTRLARDLLGALGSAHAVGVLHRDVKPSNVLVDGDGFRITDFGIASVADETATSGDLMGTLVYLAPERFDGAPATPQSDVFAAAVVLYEALAGTQPFRSASTTESLARLRSGRFEPLPSEVGTHLADAIAAALDPDPARRPADAAAFARRIDAPGPERAAMVSTEPAAAVPAEAPTERVDLPVGALEQHDVTEHLDHTDVLTAVGRADAGSSPVVPAPAAVASSATVFDASPRSADAPPTPAVAPRPAHDASTPNGRLDRAAATPAAPAGPTLAERLDRLRSDPRVEQLAERARRPQTIFIGVGIVLLVLLLIAAASSSGGDDRPVPADDPRVQLDQQLDRLEELG